jgi:hypothetical protein
VTPTDDATRRVPGTLRVAAALTALEGLAFGAYGVALLPDLFGDHPEAGSTSLFFFLAYAVFLGVCAWQLWRLRSWARAPVVLAQLIQLLVGSSFWGGSTTAVAVILMAVAVAVLVALLHPRSLAALEHG